MILKKLINKGSLKRKEIDSLRTVTVNPILLELAQQAKHILKGKAVIFKYSNIFLIW